MAKKKFLINYNSKVYKIKEYIDFKLLININNFKKDLIHRNQIFNL